jgi:hypothetical protein
MSFYYTEIILILQLLPQHPPSFPLQHQDCPAKDDNEGAEEKVVD